MTQRHAGRQRNSENQQMNGKQKKEKQQHQDRQNQSKISQQSAKNAIQNETRQNLNYKKRLLQQKPGESRWLPSTQNQHIQQSEAHSTIEM